MKTYVIIKIAGKSTRTSGIVPKQFQLVNKKPLFIYTLENFQNSSLVDYICVVTSKEAEEYVKKSCLDYGISKAAYFAIGGETGNDSTFNGYLAFCDILSKNDIIISHDGVRPLTTVNIIDNVIRNANKVGTFVTPGIRPAGMLLFGDGKAIIKREDVVELQTPTAFINEDFSKMYNYFSHLPIESKNDLSGVDSIAFKLGYKVNVVPGNTLNFKITTDSDLKMFEALCLLQ